MKKNRLTRLARGILLVVMLAGLGYIMSRFIGQQLVTSTALLPVGSVQAASQQISSLGSFVSVVVLLICLVLGLVASRFKKSH